MGLIAQCDGGCGATTDDVNDYTKFGTIKKVWYCEECAKHMADLYLARNKLHTEVAAEFHSRLLRVLDAFGQLHPKARLPDAPE